MKTFIPDNNIPFVMLWYEISFTFNTLCLLTIVEGIKVVVEAKVLDNDHVKE